MVPYVTMQNEQALVGAQRDRWSLPRAGEGFRLPRGPRPPLSVLNLSALCAVLKCTQCGSPQQVGLDRNLERSMQPQSRRNKRTLRRPS